MTPRPLRRVLISNFRRLKGKWEIPLDAPIVLIHGANGSGKTSVLAAIEFALTGEIRSMRLRDARYTAYLPHRGSLFATIEIEIADEDGKGRLAPRVTVGGDDIDGPPALDPERAQFYTERSYLDQESLGQLLDLYQYTEGNQESALARFVNELHGLDQLDALRSGLHDALDVRRVRNLVSAYPEAEREAAHADELLNEASGQLSATRTQIAGLGKRLQETLTGLGFTASGSGAEVDLAEIELLLANDAESRARTEAEELVSVLIELRGRIRGLSSRPGAERLENARATVATATTAAEAWRSSHEAPIATLRNDMASLGIDTDSGLAEPLAVEASALERRLTEHEAARVRMADATQNVDNLRDQLETVNAEISRVETRTGSLATALAALREQISGEFCPVCDRDFSEIAVGHLQEHVDSKIDDLAIEGAELEGLVNRRTELGTLLLAREREVSDLDTVLLADAEFEELTARHEAVAALRQRLNELSDAIAKGVELRKAVDDAATAFSEIEAEEREQQAVTAELAAHASALSAPAPAVDESPGETWARLNEVATRRSQDLNDRNRALSSAAELVTQLRDEMNRSKELTDQIAEIARSRRTWEQRVNEADRRIRVARSVVTAASETRTAIVQRVFTQSLNDVWRDVFSRLAPAEPFVPAFGIPTTTRAALELSVETIHKSGGTAGTPSMMLSTGNLNTAALSLFIALHLAVKPQFPCLVFDDPVQSMDEIHIAQFAGLLRLLSKQHDRQIVVAVHERELFDYLTLELSPAFAGDQLITVELGLDPKGDPFHRSTRLVWTDDEALAI